MPTNQGFPTLSTFTARRPATTLGEDVTIGLVDTETVESASFNDAGIFEIPSKWKGECVKGLGFSSSMCNKKLIGARRMTPRAHVAMYKVLWYAGGYASDVLATISLSLGIGGLPLYKEPVPMATFAGMEKGGIFVASSAGNQGPWPGTLHDGVPWLLDVPAGTIDHDCIGVVALGNGVSIIGASLYHGN
ncbi:hypothetical protein AAG906_023844 [Vitis piasezkii]